MQINSSQSLALKRVVVATATFLLCDAFHVSMARGQSQSIYYAVSEREPDGTRRLPLVENHNDAAEPSHYVTKLERLPPINSYGGADEWDPYGPRLGSGMFAGEPSEPDGLGKGPLGGPDGPGGMPGGGGGPGNGGFGGQEDEPGYAGAWYPSAAVSGQGTELGILRNRVGVDVPVWFKGADAVMMSVSVDESHFSGQAILPDTQRAFPSNLWNIQFGLKHMRQYANGWTSMLMSDIGSASDKPFQSMREVTFQIGGFLMIPAKNGRDSWMIGTIYSPLGTPNFPIPLLSYSWKPSETFQMNIGVPCNIKWRPTDRLSIDVSYFPLMNVNAIATYKLSDRLQAYGGYLNVTDSWFLADRVDRNSQFMSIDQRLIVGLRHNLSEKMTLDFNGGYAFDRHFGVGTFQTDLTDQVDLAPGAFLAGRLSWNF